MADSSPVQRRSYQWSSPQRSVLSDYLAESRNSEERHKQLLENAAKEHERVRADAQRVYVEHERREQQRLVREETKREQDRLRLEAQIAQERAHLERLKTESVSPPKSPEVRRPPSQLATPEPAQASAAAAEAANGREKSVVNGVNGHRAEPLARTSPFAALNTPGQSPLPPPKAVVGTFGTPPLQHIQNNGSPALPSGFAPPAEMAGYISQAQLPKPGFSSSGPVPRPAPTAVAADKYVAIHQRLKTLRQSMTEQAKNSKPLKSRMGDMRREIRKSVGQLTSGRGANAKQTERITTILREALSGSMPTELVDPNDFVLEPRNPAEGALLNEPRLPSLFMYLLNIFSKAAMAQWANEGSAKPETAGPVGVVVVAVFAEPEFLWRGQSLIDMLIAKFRVACPPLFGLRGSEATEQGRQRLGWKRERRDRDERDAALPPPPWVSDQQHYDSMAGLGAGFAAIALRSFGKSKKKNPFPPTHYWTAVARIVATPGPEISNSQCIVLKAMIANVESKFIAFYGNAAIQALRVALIEFPERAPEKTASVTALSVHAEVLKRDLGLVLTW